MANSDDEKTEEATPQRREDFRKRGQVAQTKELGSLLIVVGSLLSIWLLSSFFLEQLTEVFTRSFTDFLVRSAREGEWVAATRFAVTKMALVVGPLTLILFILSFTSSVVQIGFLVNEEALKFDLKRLDPLQGLKRIFSMRSLVEGLKAVVKVTIVASITFVIIKSEIVTVPYLVSATVEQLMNYVGEVAIKLFAATGVFLTCLAAMDYFFQRYDIEQKMKMSKQEIKEEMKSREGDPLIKSRIKRAQREIATKRMMEDVPKADVVVTNPTHIAVALRYSAHMAAPTVVAKGAGVVAERIKEVAKEHNVPIVENKPLARTMFKTIKIGQAIPRELYTAVAEILSYIFKLKRKKKGLI